jgi:hypothetical protein
MSFKIKALKGQERWGFDFARWLYSSYAWTERVGSFVFPSLFCFVFVAMTKMKNHEKFNTYFCVKLFPRNKGFANYPEI